MRVAHQLSCSQSVDAGEEVENAKHKTQHEPHETAREYVHSSIKVVEYLVDILEPRQSYPVETREAWHVTTGAKMPSNSSILLLLLLLLRWRRRLLLEVGTIIPTMLRSLRSLDFLR